MVMKIKQPCSYPALSFNIFIVVVIYLAYQCNTRVEAFQSTIHSNWYARASGNLPSVNRQIHSSNRANCKQEFLLSTTIASLVQDATDTNTRHISSDANLQKIGKSSDSQNQSIDYCKVNNLSTLVNILQPFALSNRKSKQYNYKHSCGNREIENHIVRLGQKGRTEEALQLYFAIHSLDRIRNAYRSKSMSLESKGKEVDSNALLSDITHKKMGWKKSDGEQRELSQLRKILGPLKNVRPTTRLLNLAIDACARANPVRQDMAFDLFHMACVDEKAISPNVFTFGSLLASCARNRDIDTSLHLLHELEDGKYLDVVPNDVIYSTVISACERKAAASSRDESGCSDMVDLALEVLNNATLALSLDMTIGQNSEEGEGIGVVGFNAAISTLARATEWRLAVQLLSEMIAHSNSNSRFDKGFSLELSCANPVDDALLHVVHKEKYSHRVFFIPKPDEVSFGSVLAACERAGEWEELLRVANSGKEYGVRLDGIALTSALHACQQLGLADEALEYLNLMKQLGSAAEDGGNSVSNSGGVSARRTNGRMRKGAKQALRGPDGVAYRLAISACARSPGRYHDCLRLLDDMRETAFQSNSTDNAPDVVAYTAAIAGCSEAGEYKDAIRLIKTMKDDGVQPNVVTFSAVINACASASAQLFKKKEEGDGSIEMDDVKTPMLRALSLLDAMRAPNSSVRPNTFTYNAAIRACAEGMNLEGAFDVLDQLKADGFEPTVVTFGSLMTACERAGNVEGCSRVFRMLKEHDKDSTIQPNEIIYGAAISCCRKAGEPERALLLLRKMISDNLAPNTATFNTVIAALCESRSKSLSSDGNQALEQALSVFKVMKSKHAPDGVGPNRITYNILVISLANRLQPGYAEYLLDAMRRDGFTPDVDLYTITVRSYERCGHPMKALHLMENMREVGIDFYQNKILDGAMKNGVKILNHVARRNQPTALLPSEDVDFDDEDYDNTVKNSSIPGDSCFLQPGERIFKSLAD